MHSTHNEGGSIGTERFIRILKNKINKHMTSVSKINKYNNTYQSTIKIKPFDIKSGTYIDFDKENNKEDPKFEDGDRVRISKYKNIFAKLYAQNWSEEVFVVKKMLKTLFHGHLNGEEIVGTFYEKELQKTNQKECRVEKVIKEKGSKPYVKWKGFDHSFNS